MQPAAVLGFASDRTLRVRPKPVGLCRTSKFVLTGVDGRRERIRTSGPYVPNVVLYQAELLSDIFEGLWGHLAGAPL